MKNSEKLKAAICSIMNDMEMDQNVKFEVLRYQYVQYELESINEETDAYKTDASEEVEF